MQMTPKTQKAQGIMALRDYTDAFGLKGPGEHLMVIPGVLGDCHISSIKFPVFARPCPFEPRHGFVDSRLVYDWAEVISILQEATRAGCGDPVEVILAPLLSGIVSAVATNAGVTWGYGNAGVTAGTDKHPITIPVKVSKDMWHNALEPLLSYRSTFPLPDCPYLEIVEDKEAMRIVQIRGGPEQPFGHNHVVRRIKVKHILVPDSSSDLLSWELHVSAHKNKVGTIIYAPGMSLSAHCCVHGIENGIPIITDRLPKIGEVIAATKNKVPALTKREYHKIAKLIKSNLAIVTQLPERRKQMHALFTAIATVQAQFCWGNQPHLLHLRSLAIVLLLKAVLAGCCGEIRHWKRERDAFKEPQQPPEIQKYLNDFDMVRSSREAIYYEIFNHPRALSLMTTMLKTAKKDLMDNYWNSSFGGRPWANVATTGIALKTALDKFLIDPSTKTWSLVIQRANRLINTSHNTGKCLTKWIKTTEMEAISKSPTVGFLNPYTAFVALGMNKERQNT